MKVLTKTDKYYGYIHLCPICETFLCGDKNNCPKCNQEIEWETWEDIQKRIDERKMQGGNNG